LTNWAIFGGISPVNWLSFKHLNKRNEKDQCDSFQSFYSTCSLTIPVNLPVDQFLEKSLLSIDSHAKIWIRNENDQCGCLSIILFDSPLTGTVNWPIDQSLQESLLSIDYSPKIWTRNENDQRGSLSIILFDFLTYNICKLTNWAISGGISPVNWLSFKHLNKKCKGSMWFFSIILFDFSTYNARKLTNWAISRGISPCNPERDIFLLKEWESTFVTVGVEILTWRVQGGDAVGRIPTVILVS
jgi:hypothetical protein